MNLPSFPGGDRDADWRGEGRRSKGRGRGKKREERDRRRGRRAREIACLFCALITDVGKARSRFCWEAFIAHEKASCLLKSYLQSAARLEGRNGRLPPPPHRAGDCSALQLPGGKGQRD